MSTEQKVESLVSKSNQLAEKETQEKDEKKKAKRDKKGKNKQRMGRKKSKQTEIDQTSVRNKVRMEDIKNDYWAEKEGTRRIRGKKEMCINAFV